MNLACGFDLGTRKVQRDRVARVFRIVASFQPDRGVSDGQAVVSEVLKIRPAEIQTRLVSDSLMHFWF